MISPTTVNRTTAVPGTCSSRTHEVTNQPPPLVGHDAAADPALLAALAREGAGWHMDDLHRLGRLAGSEEAARQADEANRFPPQLRTHDRYGFRVDEVDFHPSWHALMEVAVREGLAGAPWADPRPGAHVARAADILVWGTVEQGHLCPVSMTYAVVPALRAAPELAARYEPLLTSRVYDPGLRPPEGKAGLLAGMGMTEKQGGSDVRANTTTATPAGDGTYRLRGHKWFTSAPMNDVFLVLAQAPGGLSCFWVPRVLPDGVRNTFRIARLKDKLGNRSNASGEPEFDDTVGWLVGEEGAGVRAIIEMVAMTRLDSSLGSAAGMRAAVMAAAHHVRHRRAFGRPLIDAPLMRNVLADLALESEAATTLVLRVAGAVDRAARGDRQEQAFGRLAIAVAKYWVCKRSPALAAEALECLGGNGYVEESGMPRLYREAPLNGIWEGSGNVNALDVLRALTREPASFAAFATEIDAARGADRRLDAAWARLRAVLDRSKDAEFAARRIVERLAVVLQGSLLVRYAPSAVADAFCATRVAGEGGLAFGTLPDAADVPNILGRIPPMGA
ncbi:acyl-CoA dehydrogenase [Frankia casuarinae]|uniref:Acyl-CoA dehydrogenase-like n=2 Tax=Frankia casuarinae (strain DSM 45818 / CECT 9043 / HFP020203 / CcI3) TaxID=106370 RepID=Q2JG36_FRACC|nr:MULTISPECIES: isovaleryl-CoA dehydrogenase [Frankia]ABD09756.1 acyl-CoA dehydrogenase-like [Frankia casuarinae]ETA02263.1 acyl-CoA dehydrogenase [Frankia sp. CcI6]EYT92998.1 acyl-CoA dehydrogenase [Frankia casuarinae]KDA43297.1 acyl-CoA dehydrogenase [Frankia sp. BMG5.23]KFB03545.1 acyl-CoA dehydrogenase [Frankia sp. Allo2]